MNLLFTLILAFGVATCTSEHKSFPSGTVNNAVLCNLGNNASLVDAAQKQTNRNPISRSTILTETESLEDFENESPKVSLDLVIRLNADLVFNSFYSMILFLRKSDELTNPNQYLIGSMSVRGPPSLI